MVVVARSSISQAAAGLYIVVGIIVCLSLAAPILWYLHKKRTAKLSRWKAKITRISALESSTRTAESSLQDARRQLTNERRRAGDLEQGNEQLRMQRLGVDIKLLETEVRAGELGAEAERLKGEVRRQGDAVTDLQGEVVGLEEQV